MHRLEKPGRVVVFSFLAIVAGLFCFSTATAQGENRGDLNLNGLPFELADAAIFANYFATGMSAFTIDPDSQIAATDIDMDGLCLTVADYVMMTRIEMGEGDPPPADPDTFAVSVTYNYTDTSVIVSARFDEIPSSMYMEFDFAAEPTWNGRLLRDDGVISMGTAGAGRALAMLITGMSGIPSGSGYVSLVELAYQEGGPTSIRAGVLGTGGDQGIVTEDTTYIVGDVNDDGKINIGDAIYIIRWIFSGGFVPPHLPTVDVNCDGAYNIGDAVYIISYIFRSGPCPCGPPTGGLVSHSNCLAMETINGDGQKTATQDCIEYQYDGQGMLTLTHTNAGLNCCPENFAATVTIEEGVITIDETPIPGLCECLCLFNIDYRVISLPPGTYQISVREQCLDGDDLPLQFTADLVSGPSGSFCLERDHYPW
ncbi:MAG: dockerin type I repeat-containing protein [candidate division Zixibacteria bacterium]|nr:dockerin type I repeat-containing protein [candidate division Zixibacteria bacterium]